MAKKQALGKGLGALIQEAEETKKIINGIIEIKIDTIETNPFQPRKNFNNDALNELAASIKKLGIIQPITIRKIEGKNKFQLISGERRFRASKIAKLKTIPAYIRIADDQGMLEMALVENIQREDLNAIEIAITYQRLIDECKLTQENLSDRIGKNRSTVTNYIRLLKLPAEIQLGIRDKKISMGHARAIISIDDAETQLMIYKQIIKYGFSVRKVEEIVRELDGKNTASSKQKNKKLTPKEYLGLEKHLTNFFKTNVEFKRNNKGKGKIVINFKTDDELEKIISVLDKISK
ncbi:MAG: chromosome partitioning protein ParB [Bacteroidetes bacterium]|nr:MAG: chromosome partitioning protein ParB [Bacteroidota bacterium]